MRKPLLPLPDDQARAIRAAVETIDESLGPDAPPRAYLREFLPAVHHATGKVLGMRAISQLLRTFAGRTLSTDTLRDEVAAYKSSFVPAVEQIRTPDPAPTMAVSTTVGTGDSAASLELVRLHGIQLDYYRSQLADRDRQLVMSAQAREAAVCEAVAAAAKLQGLQESLAHLKSECARLTEALILEQERARDDNRQNMMRVENVRSETRAVEDRLRTSQQQVSALEQQLKSVRVERDALAQRVAALQRSA